jgi:hypothetical protein
MTPAVLKKRPSFRAQREIPLILLAALLFAALPAFAQGPATGTPPFGSFAGGPDVINLANLNSHLSTPVLHKAGRGTNFSYDLSYDSSVWTKVTSGATTSWQPVWNWGWAGQTQIAAGFVHYNLSTGECNLGLGGEQFPVDYNIYTFDSFHDQFGTIHNFSLVVDDNNNQCPNDPNPPSASITLMDGSGYIINVDSTPSASVVTTKGTSVNPPLQTGVGSANFTDRNGNQVSVSGAGVFTDTLGTTALTVAGTVPARRPSRIQLLRELLPPIQ